MREVTISALKQLEDAIWFSNLGRPDTDAVVIPDWKSAVNRRSSTELENQLIDQRNKLTRAVRAADRERFGSWNLLAAQFRPIVSALVLEKLALLDVSSGDKELIRPQIEFEILALCHEAEYSDIRSIGFFSGNAYWYINGRLPLGWDEKKSKPVIH